MIELAAAKLAKLTDWLPEERAGADTLIAHVRRTGHGRLFADRWPSPRTVLVQTADNFNLRGDPDALHASDLVGLSGLFDAAMDFTPLLRDAADSFTPWNRLVYVQRDQIRSTPPLDVQIRLLDVHDADSLSRFAGPSTWLWKSWGTARDLAGSGYARGAFNGRDLRSVASTFFVGDVFEDLAVLTAPGFRRRGLSTECALALCADMHARGRVPSWTTSPENSASCRTAERCGFRLSRHDVLYVVNASVPEE